MNKKQIKKVIVYVLAGTFHEYNEYLSSQADLERSEYIYLVDSNTICEKPEGEIVRIGTYIDRWDFISLEESIEREQINWEKKKEKSKDDLDPELEYGI